MIEPSALAARFDALLREHGVIAGTRRAETFARALSALPPTDAAALYRLARLSMLPGVGLLAQFDAAFSALLAAAEAGAPSALPSIESGAEVQPLGERRGPPALARAPSEVRAEGVVEREARLEPAMASDEERLRTKDLAEMSEGECAAAFRLIAALRVVPEWRPSRRRKPAARGERLDWSGSLRTAARTAGELVRLRKARAKRRVRPLAFLCDVSGSMSPYARAMLTYAHAAARARPRVAAFAFATRLTDLTPALRAPTTSPASLSRAIPDLDGGTRIGAALRSFNALHARRGVARGGTTVIVSDGWERDDPVLVGKEMARLRRLTRRVVWVNPRKAHAAYAPLAGGMAAALPFVDEFVAGANVRSLEALAEALSSSTTRPFDYARRARFAQGDMRAALGMTR